MSNTTLRWGFIGCGDVTELKSGPPYQQTQGLTLFGVMRRNPERLEDYARRHGVPFYTTNAEELIQHPEIDAVYIATPPDSHRMYAEMVASAGKPCCVEKPLSPCYTDSLAIVEAFRRENLPLFVAYYRRTLPRFRKVKALLEQRVIGEPRHLHWSYRRPPSIDDLEGVYRWRTDRDVARGGYFDDLASHGLDLFQYYFGQAEQVSGIATNQQGLYSAADNVVASWKYTGSVTGSGYWNFGSGEREDTVQITGSNGSLKFAIFSDKPIILRQNGSTHNYKIANPPHVQQYHVERMRDTLLSEGEHPSTGLSALHTSWMMEQILGKY